MYDVHVLGYRGLELVLHLRQEDCYVGNPVYQLAARISNLLSFPVELILRQCKLVDPRF